MPTTATTSGSISGSGTGGGGSQTGPCPPGSALGIPSTSMDMGAPSAAGVPDDCIAGSTVSRMLAVLKLPPEVQEQVDRGELAIREAIKKPNGDTTGRGVKKRTSKEEKLTTSVGITVTLKARKILKSEQMEMALMEALNQVREGKRAA